MYYNDVTKKEFLKVLEASGKKIDYIENFKTLFKNSSKIERQLNKDVYNFNLDELIFMLKNFQLKSEASVGVQKAMVGQYITYCCNKKLCQNFYSIVALEKVNNKSLINVFAQELKYMNKEQFYKWLDQIDDVRDCAILALLWLGFKGKEFKEIKEMKKNQVNFINSTISNDRKTVKLDAHLEGIFYDAINATYYTTISGKELELIKNDCLIRKVVAYKNKRSIKYDYYISKNAIQDIFYKYKDYTTQVYINSTNLYRSGQFYRLYEKYGKDCTSKDIREFFKNEENQDVANNVVCNFKKEYKNYLQQCIL